MLSELTCKIRTITRQYRQSVIQNLTWLLKHQREQSQYIQSKNKRQNISTVYSVV